MKAWFQLRVWPWLKWVLSGLALVLMGVFAFGAYRRKVGELKDKNKVTKALADVKVLETRRDAHIAREDELEVIDEKLEARGNKLEAKIAASKKKAVEVSESVEGKSDAEVADRFNELFGS